MNKSTKHILIISVLFLLMVGVVSTASAEVKHYDNATQFLNNFSKLQSNDVCIIEPSEANVSAKFAIYASKTNITIKAASGTVIFKGNASIDNACFTILGSNITLQGITFINLKRSDASGGAINWQGQYGKIKDCNFINCTDTHTSAGAGAIYWTGNYGTVENCNFTNNTAEKNDTHNQYGGAIYWAAQHGKVKNCNFEGNIAESGGAIYWTGAYGTVENCTFTRNNATAYSGGAIHWQAGTTGNVTNCTFKKNIAKLGGAIYWSNAIYGNVAICIFEENVAESAGAIYWASDYGTVENCNFTNNTGKEKAGAIYWNRVTNGTVENCNFINNYVKEAGGAIYWNNANNGIVRNCNFTRNSATLVGSYGGAIYWASDYGTVENCNFTNNTANPDFADSHGGAVYWLGVYGNLVNSIFEINKAYKGGAIYWASDYGTVYKCKFLENNATYCAGAIYWDVAVNGSVDNCNFTNNTADLGGAIYWTGNYGIVKNSNFIRNNASDLYNGGCGGAIYWCNAINGTVDNCNFTNNTANDYGGAICWLISINGTIMNCNFTENKATNFGGAVYLTGNFNSTIESCTFERNTANFGGAIYIGSNSIDSVVKNCIFTKDIAQLGSAIYMHGEDRYITNNTALINNKFFNCESTGSTKANVINNNTLNLKIVGCENALIYFEGMSASIISVINVTVLGNKTKSLKIGDKINLTAVITLTDGVNNTVVGLPLNFTVNDKNYTAIIDDTTYKAEYIANAHGLLAVSAKVKNADSIILNNGELNITIQKDNVTIAVLNTTVNYGENVTIDISVMDEIGTILTGNLTIFVDGKVYEDNVKFNGGVLKYNIVGLDSGSHNVTVQFNNTVYEGWSSTKKFNVEQLDTKLSVDVNSIYDDEVVIVINLTDINGKSLNGKVDINVDSDNGYKYRDIITVNGTKSLNLPKLNTGHYNLTVTYNATQNYKGSSANNSFDIIHVPKEYHLNASDVVKYYKNDTQYHVTLTDDHDNPVANKTILVTLTALWWSNPKSYNITTNASGIATLNINLIAGKYSIVASFINAIPIVNNITVLEVSYKLTASDVIKYFKNGTQYTVKLTDQSGNAIANKTVCVTLTCSKWAHDVSYYIKTNENGTATLRIDLIDGIYSIKASFDKAVKYNNIAVYPTLTAESVIKTLKQSASLKAKLVNGQGSPLEGKEIKFTVKTKTYTFKTNSEGIATLPINLDVGTWSFLIANPETGASTRATVKVTK